MLVSVCIISFNQERFIRQAIEGVLVQKTDFKFEIIIGDDFSSDNSRNICENFALNYPDIIRLLPSNSNIGMIANFIRTLENCHGKYIAICEGDDYWTDPYKLQKQVDFLEANLDYGLVAGDIVLVNEHNVIIPDNAMVLKQRARRKPFVNVFDLLETNLINTLTVCVRSNLLKELTKRTEYENLWYIYDYWFWLNIGLKHKIKIFTEKIAAYRIHSQGISRQSGFLSQRIPLVKYEIVMALIQSSHSFKHEKKKILAGVIFNLLLNKNLSSSKKLKLLKKMIFSFNSHLFYLFIFILQKVVNKLGVHK